MKTSTFRLRFINIGIKTREVTPVSVNEMAAPFKPKIGTKKNSEIRYCIAAVTSSNPDSLAFPIPISTDESVCPNIRRNVPMMRICNGIYDRH